MTDQLVSPLFLFHFSLPCRYRRRLWDENGAQLEARYRIPSFGELEGKALFADLRMAWNEEGLAFQVRVGGKTHVPWCRSDRVEDSDGLHVWIDTRDTQTIHRASMYCHRFAFLPFGSGSGLKSPVAKILPINRAKENPKTLGAGGLRVCSERHVDGYALDAMIPASALSGYDPEEYPRLGFSYAVTDRELGWQTFTLGSEFPFTSDPSLWGSLELTRKKV